MEQIPQNGSSPFRRQRSPEWGGARLLPRFEQTEEIASFFTVTLGLSHSAENPLGSPGERGSRAKAAHGAEAPLAQTAIVTTRRGVAGPRSSGKGAGSGRGGKDWEGGQVPPSKWGGLSSGSARTLGV